MQPHICNYKNKVPLGFVQSVTILHLLRLWQLTSKCPLLIIRTLLTAIIRYVKDILQKTPKSADQVVVQPDGKWDVNSRKENALNPRGANFSDDSDDDDLIEITKNGESIRTATPQMLKQSSISFERPRDVSTSSLPSNASISSKRPHSAVIDLTSSGDEDEEPFAPAPKRLNVNGYGSPFPPAHPYRPPPPPGNIPPR
jgi:E3 SUMO-protein ligase PIAS1